jgi:aminodeoxyfutalosine synthase
MTTLEAIAEKVEAGERLSAEEGLYLLTSDKPDEVARIADRARRRKVGDTVYYASTVHIQPTNLCELSCPMCSFYAKPGWDKAWFLTPDQAMEKVKKAHATGMTEVHVVGGLWRDCDLSYYEELFTRIKALDSEIHIKALTPVEYDFLAKLHGLPIEEVLQRMMGWGLGSLPGGGAEILVEKIRKQVAPQKISSEEYLAIHKIAHGLGLPSNVTMLFGHVEEPKDVISHLLQVRELQDETGGFRTFVPLKYHTENNALGKRTKRLKTPKSLVLVYAVARLMLDNVRNLKVLWKYVGIDTAKQLLSCGGNDLSSTYDEEMIIELAGSIQAEMTKGWMDEMIREIGREPMEIHSGHHYKEQLILV